MHALCFKTKYNAHNEIYVFKLLAGGTLVLLCTRIHVLMNLLFEER